MSTSDYNLENLPGAQFRAELNQALVAIATNNSSDTEPLQTFAHMLWADTTAEKLKQRNSSNNGWVNVCSLTDASISASQVPQINASKIDTGVFDDARISDNFAQKSNLDAYALVGHEHDSRYTRLSGIQYSTTYEAPVPGEKDHIYQDANYLIGLAEILTKIPTKSIFCGLQLIRHAGVNGPDWERIKIKYRTIL